MHLDVPWHRARTLSNHSLDEDYSDGFRKSSRKPKHFLSDKSRMMNAIRLLSRTVR